MTVAVIPLENRLIEALVPQIVAIYRDAFVLPPYHKPDVEIAEFADSLPIHMEREAFRFMGAFEGGMERIVGFAYGYETQRGQWWLETVKQMLPPQVASEWLGNRFQFAEIAVSPKYQGKGIGGRLHDQLLDGLPHERAVLSTLQAETAAHHLYRRRGWVVLREDLFFPGVDRRYQIMGLELRRPNK